MVHSNMQERVGIYEVGLEEANLQGYKGNIERLGMPDSFVPHGSVSQLYHLCGIDVESIAQKLLK